MRKIKFKYPAYEDLYERMQAFGQPAYIQSSPPSNAGTDSIWINSDDGIIYELRGNVWRDMLAHHEETNRLKNDEKKNPKISNKVWNESIEEIMNL